ncbi:unnamed protein product (macronuclear) [Paramecium tetraurelia]|uniref:Transmembrane protein n=1 Tax=Paramecium tetraurelia TaxID=5888 RepID=A0D5M5_PARTE|nr:uncharacterized protein GSPATT00013772001 [Paramecium tetraurelia]CAK78342.1 unnamed protein product [Paramecium tetraurelia]|eukprot:XP_001445739.1 hypothetical protein (macronuclear) [Paramecium tetraurelia strain d4-2]
MNLLEKITYIITRLLFFQIRCFAITLNDSLPIQKYNLLENEKIFSHYQIGAFPLDNQTQQDYTDIEFPLIDYKQTIKTGSLMVKNVQPININDQELAIMTIIDDEMICLLQLNTYSVNDELRYLNCSIRFKFESNHCFQVYQISNDQLLIICQKDANTIYLYLQNFDNQVINQYELSIIQNCKVNSAFQDSFIIIYQSDCIDSRDYTDCQQTELVILKIEEGQIKSYYKKQLAQISATKNIDIEKTGKLREIQICFTKNLVFVFTKGVYYCNVFNQDQCYQIKSIYQYSTIVKVYNSCSKSNVLEYTDKGEWYFKRFLIDLNNLNYKDYVNSGIIQNKLLVFSKDDLYIIASSRIYNKRKIQVQTTIPIANLSYFALLDVEGKLQIYQMNYQRYYYTYSRQLQLIAFLPNSFYEVNTNLIIIQMEKYDSQNPPFLIGDKEIEIYHRNFETNLSINRNQIQRSIPFQILKIERNGRFVNYQQQTRGFQCKYNNKVTYINLWFFEKMDLLQILILELKSTIQINVCSQGRLMNHFAIPLHQNFIGIVVNEEYLQLLIVYQNELNLYQLIDMELVSRQIRLEEKIIKILNNKKSISLILDDCKIILLSSDSINSYIEYFQYNGDNCTEIQFLADKQLTITHDQIIKYNSEKIIQIINLPYKVFQVSFCDNLQPSFFLIFYELQQMVNISLFFDYQEKVEKLYDLPLHNFQIKIPLNYQYQNSYLMILAYNNEFDDVLLIYNCRETSIESLVWITQLDQNEKQFFGFINSNLDFFYIKNKSIVIQNINHIQIILEEYENNFQSFIPFLTFNFILESQLQHIKKQANIEVKQYFINSNQSLALLKEDFIEIDSKGYINLINIYGIINYIAILENSEQGIIHPLTLSNPNEILECLSYSNNLCLQSDSVFMLRYQEQILKLQLDKAIMNDCLIFFDKQLDIYSIIELQDFQGWISISITKLKFEILQTKGQVSINKTLEQTSIILMAQVVQILNVEGLIILIQDYIDGYLVMEGQYHSQKIEFRLSFPYFTCDTFFITNGTYFFMAGNNQYLQLKVFSFKNIDQNLTCQTLFSQELEMSQIMTELHFSELQLELSIIKILAVDFDSHSLKFQAILFLTDFFAFSFSLHYNIDQQIVMEMQIQSLFRYSNQSKFNNMIYLDQNFIIIKVSNTSSSSLLIYDLNLTSQKKELDAIQLIPDQTYTLIEKFNETHHVILQHDKDILQVQFIQLSKYQIKCFNQCNFAMTLQLQNDCSSIIVKAKQQNDMALVNYNYIIILLICFLCIIKTTLHRKH